MAQTSIFSTPLHCCRPCALETVSMGEERQRNSGHAVPEPQRFHSLNHRSGRRCFGALLSTKPRPTLAPRPRHARPTPAPTLLLESACPAGLGDRAKMALPGSVPETTLPGPKCASYQMPAPQDQALRQAKSGSPPAVIVPLALGPEGR